MTGFTEVTTSSTESPLPNAFTPAFFGRLAERDEPPTAGDAAVAGPWRIESTPGHGFGLFRVGESLGRGFASTAVFPPRWLALLMAGILPGTCKVPLLLLSQQPDTHGAYPVTLAGGSDGGDGGDDSRRPPVGGFQLFDTKAID